MVMVTKRLAAPSPPLMCLLPQCESFVTAQFEPSDDIAMLLAVMARLRTPDLGCPWDLEQTFETIAPYTIEEAYEVADAIARGDLLDVRDELGDLLLQVVFHARMAEEKGVFAFGDVVRAITSKLIRRHPHVFGDMGRVPVETVNWLWASIKAEEKRLRALERGEHKGPQGALANVPMAAPALTRALKVQAAASKVGFDWNDARAGLDKVREEAAEIVEAEAKSAPKEAIEGEIGDLLFALVNLARHMDVDPEKALDRTNDKFVRRFSAIENALAAEGRTASDASLDEMEALWAAAKMAERSTPQAG